LAARPACPPLEASPQPPLPRSRSRLRVGR
jgi:hypothetical protein